MTIKNGSILDLNSHVLSARHHDAISRHVSYNWMLDSLIEYDVLSADTQRSEGSSTVLTRV